VLADYEVTNAVIADVLASLVAALGDESMISRVPLAMKRAQPDALRAVLDRMDREFGGAAGWLRVHGFDNTELDLLRHRLVELPA
jgi:hypothetical protein